MTVGKWRRILSWIFYILFSAFLLTACGEGLGVTPTPGQTARSVEPIFKEFYQTLGGQAILGPAISGLQARENLQCQYTERTLMCFNGSATDAGRFSLYPLGKELGIQEDVKVSSVRVTGVGAAERGIGDTSATENARVVDGLVIYEKFLPLYDRLFGARYVGRPMTELRVNQDLQRVEQFFENVGFYQDLADPNGPVYLIPYGAYLCGGNCSSHLNEYWSIVKTSKAEQPFAASMARLGGPAVFGTLLLNPQVASDGNLEQVYTNAIFYAPQDRIDDVRLRPLPLLLGYEVQPLTQKIGHDQLVFYEIENGLGHNVPKPFDAFIAMHGGRDLSGKPISEVVQVADKNLYQQCFENYCLIFDPSAPEQTRVQMAPLGTEYMQRFPAPEEVQIRNVFSPEKISITASADKLTLNDDEEQYIRILVRQIETGQPVERVEATLTLFVPDQPSVTFFFPPTRTDGTSVATIPPQPKVANGTRLTYEVCLNLPSEQPICSLDSYLIWNIK